MTQTVAILGLNGRIGQESAKAFLQAGWRVIGMGRSDKAKLAGVEFVQGDAWKSDDVRRACAEADVVVNTLNLPYDKWGNGQYEAFSASVIEGLKGSGKVMIFAGNIYNYAADETVLTPDTPHRPARDKGEIRERIEQMYRSAAKAGNFKFINMRSPDFYGPGAVETNFDLAVMARLNSGVLQYPGPLHIGHSWGYLPDIGRAYVRLAEEAGNFSSTEEFLFSGHYATGQEMVDLIQSALPEKVKVTQVPWWLLSVIGLFVPVVREVVKMRYLWFVSQRLEDKRLDAILGPDFATPFDKAVRRTTRSYLPAVDAEAGAPATA